MKKFKSVIYKLTVWTASSRVAFSTIKPVSRN